MGYGTFANGPSFIARSLSTLLVILFYCMVAVQYRGVRKGGKEGPFYLVGISIAHFLHEEVFSFPAYL